jgi:hypothetical protein
MHSVHATRTKHIDLVFNCDHGKIVRLAKGHTQFERLRCLDILAIDPFTLLEMATMRTMIHFDYFLSQYSSKQPILDLRNTAIVEFQLRKNQKIEVYQLLTTVFQDGTK